MATRRQLPEACPPPERFDLAAAGEGVLERLELEHATLAPIVDVRRDDGHLVVRREPAGGRRLVDGRIATGHAAALLLQASAAAAFFASGGLSLGEKDFGEARWDLDGGSARLWLTATPSRAPASEAVVPGLRALLALLFGRGGRIGPAAARDLAAALDRPEARTRRPEHWTAAILRAFPELAGPSAAEARRRCLGIAGEALRSRRSRALSARVRAFLGEGAPRVFEVDGSALAPGSALALPPPAPRSAAEASRRLRGEAAATGRRSTWIAVAKEGWDSLSRSAFDAAVLRLGDRVTVLPVPAELPLPEGPEEWRRALWLPCGTLAASIRFYEWFSGLGAATASEALARAADVLAWSGFARFVADPTGSAPLPPGLRPLHVGSARSGPERAPRDDPHPHPHPGRRIEEALAAGRWDVAVEAGRRWIDEMPGLRPEAWFTLSSLLAAHAGERFVPWLESLEAEREIAGGRPREARARLERVARAPLADEGQRRRARLRLAEVLVLLGDWAGAARRAAEWRREYPEAPADESVRALRLGAVGLAREGRTDCALALLDEAERFETGLEVAERAENGLTRAQVLALAGRFEEEDQVYEARRPAMLAAGDERVAARFLAQEARGLLDRREYARALLRFGEALAAAPDDPAERSALSIDRAATLYHAGDAAGSEKALEDAIASAAAAGREDLARLARGNRIELLIDRGAFPEAGSEIAEAEAEARRTGDSRRRLVALHQRSRLALRRGELAAAARDNAEARELARALGDRLEIGELWLEEGDRRALMGDREGARDAWQRAAADPPDRCDTDRLARSRLAELAWDLAAGPPAEAAAELDRLALDDPLRAGETLARWSGLFGPERIPGALRDRLAPALRSAGAGGLAELVSGGAGPRAPEAALRALRGAVAGALSGDGAGGERCLPALGLTGLALRGPGGGELVRLGPLSPAERWRPLDAGADRFELALSPEEPATAASVALVLETLLYRAAVGPAPISDFAEGWSRLGLVTADASMEEPYRRLARFAPQTVTVLILGESGSGKEAVARAVHRLSPRASGPFVAVNIPAIPTELVESELFGHVRGAFSGAERDRRGLLEEANGGTIFFDEIGDLAPPLQSKLLRTLQEREVRRVGENRARPVDVRVVSATSRDLAKAVEEGRFREDLFYRLHVALVKLPSLRERGRDALLLAHHFLGRYAREYGRGALRLSAEAAGDVLAYPWPGNVRELQNVMAQAAALSDGNSVGSELLPEAMRRGRAARPPAAGDYNYRSRVDAHRRDLIADALSRSGGNRSRAARELGLSRQALLYLIKELRVPVPRA